MNFIRKMRLRLVNEDRESTRKDEREGNHMRKKKNNSDHLSTGFTRFVPTLIYFKRSRETSG